LNFPSLSVRTRQSGFSHRILAKIPLLRRSNYCLDPIVVVIYLSWSHCFQDRNATLREEAVGI
jgi:hypothetical protein